MVVTALFGTTSSVTLEAGALIGSGRPRAGEHLERYLAPRGCVVGAVDFAHSAH